LDTAETSAGHNLDLDVARLAPGGAPGVSHEPVVHAGLGAPADDVGGVVEVGTAGGVGEDTGGVVLEAELVSLDGDGEGGGNKGVLHGIRGVGGDVLPASALNTSVVAG